MKRLAASFVFMFLISSFFLVSVCYSQQKKAAPPGAPSADELDEEIQKEIKKEEAAKKRPKEIKEIKKELLPNMVLIKGGCYDMGDFTGNGDDDERPVHEVCVGNYLMADTEVTQALWEAVMGFNHNQPPAPNKPITDVSWNWASRFIAKLNKITKRHFRLPTEAEWEYAARARGKKIQWSGTDEESELGDYAWFGDNANEELHPVKQKKPNELGIYDMSGNVWELVEDNFDFDYYQLSPKKDPHGPDISYWRVIRGGSVAEGSYKQRTTYRHAQEPDLISKTVGFRIAE